MRKRFAILTFALLVALAAAGSLAAQIDPELLAGMKARSIGPAGMSGRIADIVAVESNPNVIYVGASTGGVWKSVNGGMTWTPIFDDQPVHSIGALAVFQANPDIVWVGTGEGNTRNSVSVGNGIYRSLDAGRTWTHLGLADTERIHRILLHPTNPDVAYVCAPGKLWGENRERGVFQTEDGGKTWKKVNEEATIAPRPFYYADIRIDPERPNRVYSLHSQVTVSDDSGKTFRSLIGFNKLHPDHHAMWINPRDPRHIIEGNDGGVGLSYDRGETWRFVANLPLAQFYHVNVDMGTPYRVMGGLQDNGSWWGPSTVWENGGIRNQHWEEVGFGDGFDVVSDPQEPWMGYSMSQEGYLMRWNVRTGERKDIRPPAPDGVNLRFNWNSALAIDPFEPRTIYYGSQFVHKSTDRGDTWTMLSPDLTTNNPEWQKQEESGGLTIDASGAENFTTIVSIAPSAVERGIIWVGTDDGRLHVTRDAGKTWTSVEKNIKGVPENTWIPHIRPSKFSGGAAFVVFDNHRRSDWTPYLYKTTDYGKSWTRLATKDIRGYALAIEQDTVKEDLLFLGTEFGLYVSLDGGKSWLPWKHGVPTASAMDLAVHPREHDLVVATHGRALYILDDLRPLRSLTAEVLKEPVHLFEPPDAQQYVIKQTGGSRFPGQTEYRGENRPYGALLTYSLNFDDLPLPNEEKERERKEQERQARAAEQPGGGEEKKDEKKPQVDITIADASGKIIRSFKGPAVRGVNRAVWNLRRDAFKEPRRDTEEPSFFEPGYLEVLPGSYTVTVKYKDKEAKGTVQVAGDPRYEIPMADREAKWAAIERAGALLAKLSEAIDQLRDTRSDIEVAVKKVEDRLKDKRGDEKQARELQQAARALQKALSQMERRLWVPPRSKGIQPDTDVMVKVRYVLRSLGSSWDKPTDAQLTYLRQAEADAGKVLADFDQLFATQVSDFRRRVREAGIELLPEQPAEAKQG